MDFNKIKASLTGREVGLMDGKRPCALLVPLVMQNGELCLLYEVRAQGLSLQPGEVCFPGGKIEGSETPVESALRETYEELGIPADQIEILGEMDIAMHSGGFPVHPVLAKLSDDWSSSLKLNKDEVEEVFTIPLSYLRYNAPRRARIERQYRALDPMGQMDLIASDKRAKLETTTSLFWPYEGKLLWGLSARITQWLLDWLKEHK